MKKKFKEIHFLSNFVYINTYICLREDDRMPGKTVILRSLMYYLPKDYDIISKGEIFENRNK